MTLSYEIDEKLKAHLINYDDCNMNTDLKKYKYYFFAILPLLLISSCVAGYKVEKAISTDEINLVKNALHNISIDSIDREIYEASFLNSHRGKYSYFVVIYASNDTLNDECLKKKIEDIVNSTIKFMSKNKMRLYRWATFYYSDTRNMDATYEIDENLKAHLTDYYHSVLPWIWLTLISLN